MSPIKYLSQTEVECFFSVISQKRDRALFALVYSYGLRVSEAAGLLLSDVDLTHELVFIRRVKNGKSGERPLLSHLVAVLESYLEVRLPTGDALFTGRQGNLSPRRIQQLFERYAQDAGISGFSVHCLRHSIATHLLEAGLDISYVQDHLGHARIESTKVYAQITDKRRLEAFHRMEQSDEIVKVY